MWSKLAAEMTWIPEPAETSSLRDMIRGLLAAKRATPTVHADDPAAAEAGWRAMLADHGLLALLVPDELGGQAASATELIAVAEELGKIPIGGALLETAAFANPLLASADDPTALTAYFVGDKAAAVAAVDFDGSPRPLRCRRDAAGAYVISGEVDAVADAGGADAYLVAGETTTGVTELFLVERASVTRTAIASVDPSRPIGSISLHDAIAHRLGSADSGLDDALAVALACLAADCVGGMQAVVDSTVRYGHDRSAFGQPVGTFQAFKLRCADMYLATLTTRTLVAALGGLIASGAHDALAHAQLVKAAAAEEYARVAGIGVVQHGAMGFTWESHLHALQRRAIFNRAYLGPPPALRRRAVARFRRCGC